MSTVEIAAKDVKALRERTGAGMMDCKKALTEAQGDIGKAIEILRVKQGKKIQDLGERAVGVDLGEVNRVLDVVAAVHGSAQHVERAVGDGGVGVDRLREGL